MNPPAILQGDVRQQLRTLPDEHFHTVVTSPPYWGLRAYGTDPQIWGGDPLCVHQWGEDLPGKRARWGELDTLSEKQASNRGSADMVAALEAPAGCFCQRCGAWRGELGLEPTLGLFVAHMVEVFREVRRVLRRDGTCWVNMGDCYAGTPNGWAAEKYRSRGVDDRTFRDKPFATTGDGLKPKDLCLMPARVAIALQDDGWWVRSDIIWHKPNPLPESIKDRPTKSHEYLFLLTKSEDYFFDDEAVREPAGGAKHYFPAGWASGEGSHAPRDHARPRPSKRAVGPSRKFQAGGRNATDGRNTPHAATRHGDDGERVLYATRHVRSVWSIPTQSFRGAHFATFPEALVRPCIQAGPSEHGCCSICGAPWMRVVEKGEVDPEWQRACGGDANGEYHGQTVKPLPGWHNGQGSHLGISPPPPQDASAVKARILEGMRDRRTTGWRPGCDCHRGFAGDPVPCRVLDPFGGSMTTLKVAMDLGREGTACELQPEYIAIGRQRLGLDAETAASGGAG